MRTAQRRCLTPTCQQYRPAAPRRRVVVIQPPSQQSPWLWRILVPATLLVGLSLLALVAVAATLIAAAWAIQKVLGG